MQARNFFSCLARAAALVTATSVAALAVPAQATPIWRMVFVDAGNGIEFRGLNNNNQFYFNGTSECGIGGYCWFSRDYNPVTQTFSNRDVRLNIGAGLPGTRISVVSSLNSANEAIGSSSVANGEMRPTYWNSSGQAFDNTGGTYSFVADTGITFGYFAVPYGTEAALIDNLPSFSALGFISQAAMHNYFSQSVIPSHTNASGVISVQMPEPYQGAYNGDRPIYALIPIGYGATVPEPAGLALVGSGLLGMGLLRRRSSATSQAVRTRV